MADDFGPNGVYANIPRTDSRGRPQLPMFLRWNPDPVGNDATNLSGLSPDLQKVIAQARADNPNLNFVIGNGKRSASDQDQAKAWGWSKVGSKDGGDANVHMAGNAVDLWGLDRNGRVQFDPGQQKQISQAIQAAAQKLGVGVNWGGDWKSFKDAPHFELAGGGSAQASGAPEGPTAASAAPAPQPSSTQGTTINSNGVLDTMRHNIGQYESGGDYNILGKRTNTGDQAVGKYQVMKSNIPGWTQRWLGRAMTPEEFRASPQAQDAVFNGEFGSYLKDYSPADASSKWFTGQPLAQGANKRDILGTTGAKYVAATTKGIDNPYAFNGASVAQAPGPIDPSIIAHGGTSPPIPTTPGTTINSNPVVAAIASGQLGDAFKKLNKTLGGKPDDGQDQGQQQPQPSQVNFPQPQARNVSALLGGPGAIGQGQVSPVYAQRMAALAQPMQWGVAPPGQMFGAGFGPQNQPVYGTSLMSQFARQQQMLDDPMWTNQTAGAGYG